MTARGVDLLLEIIPKVIACHPSAYFIIGGDGEKVQELERLVDGLQIQDRVEIVYGEEDAAELRDMDQVIYSGGETTRESERMLLNRGHILLNTTHAGTFCITGLEAASCGLVVVSTNVDGIGEVLPVGLAYIAKPVTDDLTQQLLRAIRDQDKIRCSDLHQFVKDTYSWHNVAERTERVYNFVMD